MQALFLPISDLLDLVGFQGLLLELTDSVDSDAHNMDLIEVYVEHGVAFPPRQH
jgi:hypothetical protein